MPEIDEELLESLKTGFLNKWHSSRHEYRPEILANDYHSGRKVLSSLLKDIRECEEFWFSVAFVTMSGVATLLTSLEEYKKSDRAGRLLVSQYQNFTQPEALRTLLYFDNIDLRISVEGDFHAKGYLFKKKGHWDLIVGSSNLTANALCSNKEWNLKVSATSSSDLISDTRTIFESEFDSAVPVTEEFIEEYEHIYRRQKKFFWENEQTIESFTTQKIEPNRMQEAALRNLRSLVERNQTKALLVSATGTGKTYLSAFHVKERSPRRFLYIVHRWNIARKALESFRRILGDEVSMGLFSGGSDPSNAEYLFTTIQTISREQNLRRFSKDEFDYILIDETHRAGAPSYQSVLDYFNPNFLLGMTATPERTDGHDIFRDFDHNIAYEIRLHQALEEKMLCDFHYFGVTDITVDEELLDEKADFNMLTSDERVERVIEKAVLYGSDDGVVRGLIFCSRNHEAQELSRKLNERGLRTIALSGDSSEEQREEAIQRLESDGESEKLDYILSVDIFNEGIDIPRVNQIIMLRPTQSAIVFIQQLGRGLRKTEGKEYLTVIDFIGNYSNNFLIPIALYGDASFNKDRLRKLMASGSELIPGSSTVNFDEISKSRIFTAIDSTNLSRLADLRTDYELLQFKLGRIPMMMDFFEHGSRSPFLFVEYSKSYFNFVSGFEDKISSKISEQGRTYLEYFSTDIANGKRIEEVLILKCLLGQEVVRKAAVEEIVSSRYGFHLSNQTWESSVRNLNFEFITEKHQGSIVSVREKHGLYSVESDGDIIRLAADLESCLRSSVFKNFLSDLLNAAEHVYGEDFDESRFFDGFHLYRKYSRKDVFRILNWSQNPVAQNVGGYMFGADGKDCAIFVNYHKAEDISETTRYEDGFLNNYEFQWMTKSNRTLNSPEVLRLREYTDELRLPLFVKKSNDEGKEFYYMGDVVPVEDSFEQEYFERKDGREVPVVKVLFTMKHPVEHSIYEYITSD
ncbi:MAG: DEAD/DEAH box helicase [Acidobacteriota bacterium]|nr:MAG: DEAD/DEAH box helicase [Acidobacteriota bacterium]